MPVSATIELEVGEGLPDVLETDSIPAEESVPTEQLDLFN